ncbi:MAG: hypothetical protein LUI12_03655, partial [Clostridiales bacterium]|nr:hypothetical protein [Clostridiales bacterium]
MKVIRQDEREIGRQEGIETGRQEGIEIGKQEGIAAGIAAGQQQKLQELVRRKLEKGKDVAAIAEELEEPLENIRKICDALRESV